MHCFLRERHGSHGFLRASENTASPPSSQGRSTGLPPSPHPITSLSTSQSLSDARPRTAATILNRHAFGVLNPPKATMKAATIARFVTSWYIEIFCTVGIIFYLTARVPRTTTVPTVPRMEYQFRIANPPTPLFASWKW